MGKLVISWKKPSSESQELPSHTQEEQAEQVLRTTVGKQQKDRLPNDEEEHNLTSIIKRNKGRTPQMQKKQACLQKIESADQKYRKVIKPSEHRETAWLRSGGTQWCRRNQSFLEEAGTGSLT